MCQVEIWIPFCAADPALEKSDPLRFQQQYEVADMVLGEDAADLGKSAHGWPFLKHCSACGFKRAWCGFRASDWFVMQLILGLFAGGLEVEQRFLRNMSTCNCGKLVALEQLLLLWNRKPDNKVGTSLNRLTRTA
jgi:hypothetical protein